MPDWKIGLTWGSGVAVIVLCLAVWIFFYLEHMPLDAASTAVVALAAALIVLGSRWLWSRRKHAPAKTESPSDLTPGKK